MATTIPPVQQYKYFDITINAERTLAGSKGYSCNKLTIQTDIKLLKKPYIISIS